MRSSCGQVRQCRSQAGVLVRPGDRCGGESRKWFVEQGGCTGNWHEARSAQAAGERRPAVSGTGHHHTDSAERSSEASEVSDTQLCFLSVCASS